MKWKLQMEAEQVYEMVIASVTRAKCRRAAISARSPGGLRPVPAPSFSAGSCSLWSPEGRLGVLRLGTQGRPQARNPSERPSEGANDEKDLTL